MLERWLCFVSVNGHENIRLAIMILYLWYKFVQTSNNSTWISHSSCVLYLAIRIAALCPCPLSLLPSNLYSVELRTLAALLFVVVGWQQICGVKNKIWKVLSLFFLWKPKDSIWNLNLHVDCIPTRSKRWWMVIDILTKQAVHRKYCIVVKNDQKTLS